MSFTLFLEPLEQPLEQPLEEPLEEPLEDPFEGPLEDLLEELLEEPLHNFGGWDEEEALPPLPPNEAVAFLFVMNDAH